MASLYDMPIESLKGIGEKKGKLFRKLGANTVGELLNMYPRAYEDWSQPVPIRTAEVEQIACIKATVTTPVTNRRINGGRFLCRVRVADESDAMALTFFNNPYIVNSLKENEEYIFYGKVTSSSGRKEMVSPAFMTVQKGQGVHPVYGLTAGITSRQIEVVVKQAIAMLPPKIKDPIPDDMLMEYDLCTLRYALNNIHFPTDSAALNAARKRLMFEELLVLCIGLGMLKNSRQKTAGIKIGEDYSGEYFSMLPFSPTQAQLNAAKDCVRDMQSGAKPMSRLVQGDVGSGKTAVAAAVCYSAVKNGLQTAFMAPTEILAKQHYDNLAPIFNKQGINVGLLTGSLKASQKKEIKEKLANREIGFVIGTHALLSDNVEFANLGLVITDEQHRFGVAQRNTLAQKGNNPHLLVMSATPIPRTLALIIYGDLDVSVIDELPPGRQPIETLLIDSGKRHRMYGFLKKHIGCGRQCYIVCPTVEESIADVVSAQEYSEKISKNDFKGYSVGLMHGKMKPKDKESVMEDFAQRKIQILVSTTVIEVGVDVPNATVMVVENAERFGLSQLHQLRGRVGRGKEKSYCILVSDTRSEETIDRLKTMCRTTNGFEIADADLRLRGPGDFFGSRQHGLPQMKIASLTDMAMLEKVQMCAKDIEKKIAEGEKAKYRGIVSEAVRLFGRVGEGGLN